VTSQSELERLAATPRWLAGYLLSTQWHPVGRTEFAVVWEHGSERTQVLQPVTGDRTPSELRRIDELIATVAAVQSTSAPVVVAGALFSDADALRVRTHPHSPSGSAPMGRAMELLKASRAMLVASAATVDGPRPVLGPRKSDAAESLGANLLVATEPGSFVVTVYTTVEPDERTSRVLDEIASRADRTPARYQLLPDEPFERRATRGLMSALNMSAALANQVAEGREHVDAFEGLVPDGVSANLLEALSQIGKGGEEGANGEDATISMRWAATRPGPSQTATSVRIPRRSARVFADAAKSLRARMPIPDVTLTGKIIGLKQDSPENPGQVTIETRLPEDKSARHVSFTLAPDRYRLAVAAHGRAEAVEVRGDVTLTRPAIVARVAGFGIAKRDGESLPLL
jgi:hypothetical protein